MTKILPEKKAYATFLIAACAASPHKPIGADMSKERNAKKETKKAPAKTMKEKKADKKAKKAGK